MDDHLRPRFLEKVQHCGAIANVDIVWCEAARLPHQTLEVPCGVPLRTEEFTPHVVVDTVYGVAGSIEVLYGLGADQTAASGNQNSHHHPRRPISWNIF